VPHDSQEAPEQSDQDQTSQVDIDKANKSEERHDSASRPSPNKVAKQDGTEQPITAKV